MGRNASRSETRTRRKLRVRKKVKGTPDRPRLCVFRSARHISVQIIDDVNGNTLLAASTAYGDVKDKVKGLKKSEAAKVVGQEIATKAKAKGINRVIFDRNGFLYHGRVRVLSDSARETGLEF